ncbi:ABC transporter ATP-binding protein [Hydrogenivirga sp. 128-5-R1-1]|uniref:ABC transporter ATP-binding protein n=1 Tax=Hydrogenivirga sp. 128-5-R1-1 TaxID=392423 RepID=UPI00015EFA08|nr:ABC transporter ATP-binding protein [Hydrogenivirga sp. 128-5-R1-1]EDP75124.1 branched-chain amino acid transport ATP-binding protein [Hydrogenivirga sp. 128-5-R1-1]
MTLLEVRDLYKSFGGNRVMEGVSFSLEEGEVLGIVGPNGSGKTTLMNVISGILREDRGEVLFQGKKVSSLRPSSRARMGMSRTFQITRLFGNLTVLENVLIPLHYGSPLKADRNLAEELIDAVGLSHKTHDMADSLSLAQRKRLELARALALKPKLLLLDEVFAGLNPVSVREIVELLKRLNEERGITLLLVEHVLKALFQLTRRVLVLSEGKLIFDGSPEEMAKDPVVVKAYLGERYGRKGS